MGLLILVHLVSPPPDLLSTQYALSTARCLTVHGQSRKGHLFVVRNCKASMMTLQSLFSLPLEHPSALGIARKSIDADADKDAGGREITGSLSANFLQWSAQVE